MANQVSVMSKPWLGLLSVGRLDTCTQAYLVECNYSGLSMLKIRLGRRSIGV